MPCKAAIHTDKHYAWECAVTGSACVFLFPDGEVCTVTSGARLEVVNNDAETQEGDYSG